MPGLNAPELSIILRGQLSNHLPDYMRALITFNQKTSWDDLLTALDAAHPYVNKLSLPCKQEIKSEFLDANYMSTQCKEDRRCYSCNEVGHLRRDCTIRAYRNKNCGSFNGQSTKNYGNSSQHFRNSNNSSSKNGDGDRSRRENHTLSIDKNHQSHKSYNQRFQKRSNSNCNHKADANNLETFSDDDVVNEFSANFGTLNLNAVEVKTSSALRFSESADGEEEVKSTCPENAIVLDVNSVVAKVPLLRKSIRFSLMKGSQMCKLRALFDGGASNCFVRLACLPSQVQKLVKNFRDGLTDSNDSGLIKETITILGATGATTSTCVIAVANLVIGDWSGQHTVVITDSLIDKDVIIGRDFLKKYSVIINHGTDEISISKPLDSQKLSDPVCYVAEIREIIPYTENVIKCHTSVIPGNKEVLFSPCNNVENVYWSN